MKFGGLRGGPEGKWVVGEARPARVKRALAYSLQRLGGNHIDIYWPARIDPDVPVEETIGRAIAEMMQAGHVRAIGLSEVGADTIRRALAIHPISELQTEYSLFNRGIENSTRRPDPEMAAALRAVGRRRERTARSRATALPCGTYRTATRRPCASSGSRCAQAHLPFSSPSRPARSACRQPGYR